MHPPALRSIIGLTGQLPCGPDDDGRARDGTNERRARAPDPALAPDVSPLERLRRLFRRAATLQHPDDPAATPVLGCPFGNLAAELGSQDPVIRDKVREVFTGYQAAFEGVLRAAQEAGEIGPLDVAAAARGVLAVLEGALLLAKTYNDAAIIAQVGLGAVDHIAGLVTPPAPVRSLI